MPISLTCPACGARLKAPDHAAGRTLRCPKCAGAVGVPVAGPAAAFSFDDPGGFNYSEGAENPFENEATDAPTTFDPDEPSTDRPGAAKKKKRPAGGYNPFDDAGAPPVADPQAAKRRKYRKDDDYNPFGDLPEADEPDPAAEGFEFGLEAPPPVPSSEFDFGPRDPRGGQ